MYIEGCSCQVKGAHVSSKLLNELGAGVKVLVDSVPKTEKLLLLGLDTFEEGRNAGGVFDADEHANHCLVRASMQWPIQCTNARCTHTHTEVKACCTPQRLFDTTLAQFPCSLLLHALVVAPGTAEHQWIPNLGFSSSSSSSRDVYTRCAVVNSNIERCHAAEGEGTGPTWLTVPIACHNRIGSGYA